MRRSWLMLAGLVLLAAGADGARAAPPDALEFEVVEQGFEWVVENPNVDTWVASAEAVATFTDGTGALVDTTTDVLWRLEPGAMLAVGSD